MGLFGNKNKPAELNDNDRRTIDAWEREKGYVKATHGNLDAFKALEAQLAAIVADMRRQAGGSYSGSFMLVKQGNDVIAQMRELQKRPAANGRPVRVEPTDIDL